MVSAFRRGLVYGLVLLALAQLAVGFTFPCERLSLQAECREIVASPMTDEQKLQTLTGAIQDAKAWNTGFPVSVPPEGVSPIDDAIVKQAWVKIFTIMPSVHDHGRLLSSGEGTVVAKGSYKIQTPSAKERGDCKTQYSVSQSSRIEQFLNGKALKKGEVAAFKVNATTLNFQANLVIDVTLIVKHYRNQKIDNKIKCIYRNTETRKYQTIVSDGLQATKSQSFLNYSFKIIDKYYWITKIRFNQSNAAWFRLQFNFNDFYEERNYELQPYFALPPYYILEYRPIEHKTVSSEGVRFENNTFLVTDTSDCQIILGDFFKSRTYRCPLNFRPVRLDISTDKTVYSPGEKIVVRVSPKVPVQVRYGNFTLQGQSSFQLIAQEDYNVITVRADNDEISYVIHVSNIQYWILLFKIAVFVFLIFLLYKILKRLLGGTHGLRNL